MSSIFKTRLLNRFRNTVLFFSFLFIFSGCEKEVPFPNQDKDPLLVINSTFNPDNEWLIHLSKTAPLATTTPSFISNGIISVNNSEGLSIPFAHEANGIYKAAGFAPIVGQAYEITVEAEDFEPVFASSYIPNDFEFSIIDTTYGLHEGLPTWFFDIEIVGNMDAENYYIVDVSYTYEDSTIVGIEHPSPDFLDFAHFSFDLNADNSNLLSDSEYSDAGLRGIYFSEVQFVGGRYVSKLGVADRNLSKIKSGKTFGKIRVKSVSKSLYEYYKSLERYRLNQGNFFAEPIQIYSNIENGVGIFAGYNENVQLLDLTD